MVNLNTYIQYEPYCTVRYLEHRVALTAMYLMELPMPHKFGYGVRLYVTPELGQVVLF